MVNRISFRPTLAGILATVILSATYQQSFAQDLSILRKVDDHYNHLATLRAHYREHYAGMGMDRSEEGTLLLKKPGRMLWRYDRPAGKVFVLDGKYAWFYTPGDPQCQRIPAKQLDDLRSPLRFLLGPYPARQRARQHHHQTRRPKHPRSLASLKASASASRASRLPSTQPA